MITSVERTEAVLDNRPSEANPGKSQRFVYVLISFIGGTLIGLGVHSRWSHQESWVPELCIAAGVAVAAPGILSYLYRKYMFEEIKLEIQKPALEFKRTAENIIGAAAKEITEQYRQEIELLRASESAGLIGVYKSRAEAVTAFLPFIDKEKEEILIIGSSLSGLLGEEEFDKVYDAAQKLLVRKKADGVRLRFLLTHPVIADLRARQENRRFKDIGYEIIRSLEYLLYNEEWRVDPRNIKLYLGTPTCFGIKTEEAMLLNTYPYMKEAFHSPCLIVAKHGYFYDHFYSSHFRAWTSALALSVPTPLSVLSEKLNDYARSIEGLVELPSPSRTESELPPSVVTVSK